MQDDTLQLLLCAQVTTLAYQIRQAREKGFNELGPGALLGRGSDLQEAISLIEKIDLKSFVCFLKLLTITINHHSCFE